MQLHPNIIAEEHDELAVYRLVSVPKVGNLYRMIDPGPPPVEPEPEEEEEEIPVEEPPETDYPWEEEEPTIEEPVVNPPGDEEEDDEGDDDGDPEPPPPEEEEDEEEDEGPVDPATYELISSGGTFTQAELRAGVIFYKQDKRINRPTAVVRDSFEFQIIDSETELPVHEDDFNACVSIPKPNGDRYKFVVNVVSMPLPTPYFPVRAISFVEDETITLTPEQLTYWVNPEKYHSFMTNPPEEAPAYPEEGWEYYPIEYVVDGQTTNYFELLLDGEPATIGARFTNDDIKNGRVGLRGTRIGIGKSILNLTVRVKARKQKARAIEVPIFIRSLTFANVSGQVGTLWECQEPRPTKPGELKFTAVGSTDADITVTYIEPEINPITNEPESRIRVEPQTFTVAQAEAGEVEIWYECDGNPRLTSDRTEVVRFNVCTQNDKCTEIGKSFRVLSYMPPVQLFTRTAKTRTLESPYMTGRTAVFDCEFEMRQMHPDDILIQIDQDAIDDRPTSDPIHRLSWNLTEFTQSQVNDGEVTITDNGDPVTITTRWVKSWDKGWHIAKDTHYEIKLPVIVSNSFGQSAHMEIPFFVVFSPESIANAVYRDIASP